MSEVTRKMPTNLYQLFKRQINPICHLLALLGAHPKLHGSRIRVNIYKKTINYSAEVRGRTIKLANSPPCACCGSTGLTVLLEQLARQDRLSAVLEVYTFTY
jgi:hypothetical protein